MTDAHSSHITPIGKIWRSVVALLLAIYASFGVYYKDLYLGGRGGGFHLQGVGAYIAAGGLICMSMSLLSEVLYPEANPVNAKPSLSTFAGKAFSASLFLCLAGVVWYLMTLAHWI